MKQYLMRCVYLLIGWLTVGLVYCSSAYFQGEPILLSPSMIDEWIVFTPHAVWFYLSFFLIIPYCFLIAPYQHVNWMSICFIVSGCLAGLCYLIWPTTIKYPVDKNDSSASNWLLEKLIAIDVPVNCFPSLHVTLTFIVIWGAYDSHHHLRNILLTLWGIAIAISIIQLRRHLFIDFIGGMILAIMVGWIVWYLLSLVVKNKGIRNCYYD